MTGGLSGGLSDWGLSGGLSDWGLSGGLSDRLAALTLALTLKNQNQ